MVDGSVIYKLSFFAYLLLHLNTTCLTRLFIYFLIVLNFDYHRKSWQEDIMLYISNSTILLLFIIGSVSLYS